MGRSKGMQSVSVKCVLRFEFGAAGAPAALAGGIKTRAEAGEQPGSG